MYEEFTEERKELRKLWNAENKLNDNKISWEEFLENAKQTV
jgi:hypothetical protein